MSNEEQKGKGFIHHLLSNPTLQNYSPLQKEEQIRVFLEQNAAQLHPTLSSPNFFPGQSWVEIRALLLKELVKNTNSALLSYLQRIIFEQIDFGFVAFIRPQGIQSDKAREVLYSFTTRIAEKGDGRMALMGPFNAIVYGLSDKYIERIFDTRNYVRFELEKVQRLRMGKEELKNMVKVSLLLRPAIYLISAQTPLQNPRAGTVAARFAQKAQKNLEQQLPLFPPQLIRSGVQSNVSFLENPKVPATSRIALLLSRLSRDYRPNMRVDRGASSPEKSWFSVARRNCEFYGFDVKMLEEFYRIAAENWW